MLYFLYHNNPRTIDILSIKAVNSIFSKNIDIVYIITTPYVDSNQIENLISNTFNLKNLSQIILDNNSKDVYFKEIASNSDYVKFMNGIVEAHKFNKKSFLILNFGIIDLFNNMNDNTIWISDPDMMYFSNKYPKIVVFEVIHANSNSHLKTSKFVESFFVIDIYQNTYYLEIIEHENQVFLDYLDLKMIQSMNISKYELLKTESEEQIEIELNNMTNSKCSISGNLKILDRMNLKEFLFRRRDYVKELYLYYISNNELDYSQKLKKKIILHEILEIYDNYN